MVVEFEDAHLGLVNSISYLSAQPGWDKKYVNMLVEVLQFLLKQPRLQCGMKETGVGITGVVKKEEFGMDEDQGNAASDILDSESLPPSEHDEELEDTSDQDIEDDRCDLMDDDLDKDDSKEVVTRENNYSNDLPRAGNHVIPMSAGYRDKDVRLDIEAWLKEGNTDKRLNCRKCEKTFKNPMTLREHTKHHAPDIIYQCSFCGRKCHNRQHLEDHEKRHRGEREINCSRCSKKFINKYDLQTHMVTHTRDKQFVCPICGKLLSYSYSLKKHMACHDSPKETFPCDICGNDYRNVKAHKKQKHCEVRSNPCLICGKSFKRKWHMQRHISGMHPGIDDKTQMQAK